jgi:hypothetical protein
MDVSGQLHAPAALTHGKVPDTHFIGGWVGPRAVLYAVVKRKIPSPRRESKPITPIVQPVDQRYTDLLKFSKSFVNVRKFSQDTRRFHGISYIFLQFSNHP